MKHYHDNPDALDGLSEFQKGISGLAFGILPPIIAWSKKSFELLSHSFFLANWINEAITMFWQTLSLLWSSNKNMRKSGNLLFDWLKFGFTAFMIFGAAALGGVASVALFGVMLGLAPAVCLVKAAYFTGKMITSNNTEEREEHYAEVKKNAGGAFFSGVLGVCLTALILIPALPTAATIAAATIATTLILPPVVIGLGAKIYQFAKWMTDKTKKWWRKIQGLQGPGYEYDLQEGTTLGNYALKEKVLYVDELKKDGIGHRYLLYRFKDASGNIHKGTFKENALSAYDAWPDNISEIHKLKPHLNTILLSASKGGILPFKPVLGVNTEPVTMKNQLLSINEQQLVPAQKSFDYYRHLSEPKIHSIQELTEKIQQHLARLTQASEQDFFQSSKRQDKIKALRVLEQALTQWHRIFNEGKYLSASSEYYSIILDQNNAIHNIANPHFDMNVTRNKDFFIKRIQQYVLENYPYAFQSFFREQGEVELVFKQGFDLIRRMKTAAEIDKEKEMIRDEISEYGASHQGVRRFLSTESETEERKASIAYLNHYLDNFDKRSIGEVPEMLSSVKGKGKRFEIYQKIDALKESEDLLTGKQPAHSETKHNLVSRFAKL